MFVLEESRWNHKQAHLDKKKLAKTEKKQAMKGESDGKMGFGLFDVVL